MTKLALIDRAAVIADLKKQVAAVYKDSMTRPIMDDDPFVEVLAKSEGRHMQLFLEDLEEYLMSRPTIDAAPVRRGEWEQLVWDDEYDNRKRRSYRCRRCYKQNAVRSNFCPNCGADMKGQANESLNCL